MSTWRPENRLHNEPVILYWGRGKWELLDAELTLRDWLETGDLSALHIPRGRLLCGCNRR